MTIHIGVPTLEQHGDGRVRITTPVNSDPLWFESNTKLQASAEAVAGLMLVPALEQGTSIVSDQPLDPVWLANVSQLIDIFSAWWGYQPQPEMFSAGACESSDKVRPDGTGLCFSGGVDSFFSLLNEGADITHLVFAHGYDIPLSDQSRYEDFVQSFELIAAEFSRQPVIIRTNLREHPVFIASSWEKTHGAALAALGHMLSQEIRQLNIASSFAGEHSGKPWGSSTETDRLWSAADMRFVHGDVSVSRLEKTLQIADDPLAQRYLRVCWQNKDSDLNCSRCEKCLRTMVALEVVGKLKDFSCFESGVDLPRAVAKIRRVNIGFLRDWAACADFSSDSALSKSIKGLVRRSKPDASGRLHRFLHRSRGHFITD